MPRYMVEVVESRGHKVRYTVDADGPTQAKQKAERGFTVFEEEVGGYDVNERTVIGDPVELRENKLPQDVNLALGMVAEVSDHRLKSLTHPQLVNLVKDLRNEAKKALKE